jgi:hypothetical protein
MPPDRLAGCCESTRALRQVRPCGITLPNSTIPGEQSFDYLLINRQIFAWIWRLIAKGQDIPHQPSRRTAKGVSIYQG